MKYFLSFVFLLIGSFTLSGQFFNNGATINIQSGATLYVDSDITNNSGGVIINSGTIELTGNLTNLATITSNAGSIVKFSGTTNSEITSNGGILEILQLEKDAGFNLVLMDNMIINDNLNFIGDDNKVVLGDNNTDFTSLANITGADNNNYIVTSGAGYAVKQSLSNFTFPVGFNTTTYNPITIEETGAAENVQVRVLEQAYEDGPAATTPFTEEVVDASWEVNGGDVTNFTVQWDGSDELSLTSDVGIGRYNSGAYDLTLSDLAAKSGADPYTRSRMGITEDGLFIVGGDPTVLDFVLVSPTAFLDGPFNEGNMTMNEDLRTNDLIPTAEPYSGLGYTHVLKGGGESVGSTADFDQGGNDNVVDWVFVELRDETNNATVVATYSGLIQRDGNIVGTDMQPIKFLSVPPGNYYVAVRHRNHLGIMTSSAIPLDHVNTALDFTDGSTAAFGSNAQKSENSILRMWPGDANGDGDLKYQGANNDNLAIRDDILAQPGNFFNLLTFTYDGYALFDVNMDGTVKYQGANNDNLVIRDDAVLFHPGNFFNLLTFAFSSQLP